MNARKKITYDTFLHRVAARTGGHIDDVDRFLHRLGPAVESALKQEGRASLAGFGAFDLREIEERPGHNFQSKEATTVEAHTRIHFSPFQALKWSVNWPYRLTAIQLLPQDEQGTRALNWLLLAIAVLLLAAGLAGWFLWAPGPADHQAVAPAAKAVPAAPAVGTAAKAEPVAAAPAAPAPAQAFPAQNYAVQRGDNFWDLSGTLWQDTAWWPLMYVNNRADLPVADPDRLPVNIRLRTPALEGGPAAPSAKDLERLTAAYGVVAKDYRRTNNPRAANYKRVAERGFSR